MQDSLLYWHLHREHGMRLFFFCKNCFMGSVDGSVIFSHITNSNSCVRYRNWHPNNIIGMCPLGLINYQPNNEEKYMENYAAREVSKLQIRNRIQWRAKVLHRPLHFDMMLARPLVVHQSG